MRLFERIARGTTQPKEKHINGSEASSENIALHQAIMQESAIEDSKKDEAYALASELVDASKKESANGKSEIAVPVAVAAVVAAMAFHSNEAHANNPITRKLAKFFSDQLVKPIADGFNGLFDAILEPWFNTTEEASSGSTTAYASWADSNNHVKRTMYNEEIMREQAPDPQSCEMDATCDEMLASEADEAVRTINTTVALDISALETNENVRGSDFRQQMDDDIANGGDGTAPIDTAILYDRQGYSEAHQNEQAFNVLKNVSGSVKHTPSRAQADTVRRSQDATTANRMDVARATRLARRSVANLVMAEQAARRNNLASNGSLRRSRARIELDEISRNFTGSPTHAGSGAGYRDQIRGFSKPAPLLRQLNLQQAQTNNLLLQELEELKKGSALLGVQVLEMTDRRGRN